MPYRRRSYNRRARRPRRGTRRYYRKRFYRTRSPDQLPKSFKFKTTYCGSTDVATALGAYTEYQIRGNSLYDPDAEIGGHQAHLFDQLMALYTHCNVAACKITLKIINHGTESHMLVMFPSVDESPALSDVTGANEQYYSKSAIIPANSNLPVYMKGYFKTKQFKPGFQKFNRDFSCTTADNPAEEYFITYATESLGANAVASNITIVWKAVYYCTLYDLKHIHGS